MTIRQMALNCLEQHSLVRDPTHYSGHWLDSAAHFMVEAYHNEVA